MTEGERPGSDSAEERADLTGLARLSDVPPEARKERVARVIRAVSVLLLAIAAAGLPWYFLTRTDRSTPVRISNPPSPPASASASPSPTPAEATYEVTGLGEAKCMRIREEPGLNKPLLDCVLAGVRLHSDGQTREVDSLLWRRVFHPKKKVWGWAADQYLKPVG